MALLLHNFGETPFKNKSEIHNELMIDLEKVVINSRHLQNSEIQVVF